MRRGSNLPLFCSNVWFSGKEIGWSTLESVQAVRDFLYAGMENTSATVFSSRYVVDSGFEDPIIRTSMHMNWHINGLDFSHCPKRKTPLATGRICYLLCRSSRTRNMEMIISILNYTKQRSKLNMLLERIRFRFSMKTSSLSFYQKGLGLCLLYVRQAIKHLKKRSESTWINTLSKCENARFLWWSQ
jgi:aminopeptidase N